MSVTLSRHDSGSTIIATYLKNITAKQLAYDIQLVYKAESAASDGQATMLDTLKVANITQSGPTKTITGGQYADALLKFGKTARCEMTEALGNAKALQILGGAELDSSGNVYLTGKYSGTVAICGENYFIDQTSGDQRWVHEVIPQFLPDSILEFTQDAEGDATTFALNGDIITSPMKKNEVAAEGDTENSLDIQVAFIDNKDGAATAFDRFGIVTVMTNVIAVPWTRIEKYIDTKNHKLNINGSGEAEIYTDPDDAASSANSAASDAGSSASSSGE